MKYLESIETLLNESYILYKNNFVPLILISSIQSLLSLYSLLYNSLESVLSITIYLLFSLVVIYYSFRLSITAILFVANKLMNLNTNLKEAFYESSKHFWNYLTAFLVVGLMIIIPFVAFYLAFVLSDILIVKTLSIVIGLPIIIYLGIHYYYTPTIRVLDPENTTALKSSFELVKQNRVEALCVILTIALILFLPSLTLNLIEAFLPLRGLIEFIVTLLVAPLTVCVSVIYYYKLVKESSKNSTSPPTHNPPGL